MISLDVELKYVILENLIFSSVSQTSFYRYFTAEYYIECEGFLTVIAPFCAMFFHGISSRVKLRVKDVT
jgi:hypothetical protein